jgi:ATP-dependent Zn protease
VTQGPIGGANLVGKVLADSEGRQRVDDILEAQREKVIAVLEANRDVHAALRDALIARDELIRDDILEVIEQALSARA